MPPDGFAVSVTLCPESIIGDAGVDEPEDNAVLITYEPVEDVAVEEAESVTST